MEVSEKVRKQNKLSLVTSEENGTAKMEVLELPCHHVKTT